MGPLNLSIVFAPCFLRPEKMEMDDMLKMKFITKYFSILISN